MQTNSFLLQQKLQLLHLMHLNTIALEDYLKNQMEENPVLEESTDQGDELAFQEDLDQGENQLNEIEEYFVDDEIPDYKMYINNIAKWLPEGFISIDIALLNQLNLLYSFTTSEGQNSG